MVRDAYSEQVALLVRLLPFIAAEPVFALKCGNAINRDRGLCSLGHITATGAST